jgi:hypothetical protein
VNTTGRHHEHEADTMNIETDTITPRSMLITNAGIVFILNAGQQHAKLHPLSRQADDSEWP